MNTVSYVGDSVNLSNVGTVQMLGAALEGAEAALDQETASSQRQITAILAENRALNAENLRLRSTITTLTTELERAHATIDTLVRAPPCSPPSAPLPSPLPAPAPAPASASHLRHPSVAQAVTSRAGQALDTLIHTTATTATATMRPLSPTSVVVTESKATLFADQLCETGTILLDDCVDSDSEPPIAPPPTLSLGALVASMNDLAKIQPSDPAALPVLELIHGLCAGDAGDVLDALNHNLVGIVVKFVFVSPPAIALIADRLVRHSEGAVRKLAVKECVIHSVLGVLADGAARLAKTNRLQLAIMTFKPWSSIISSATPSDLASIGQSVAPSLAALVAAAAAALASCVKQEASQEAASFVVASLDVISRLIRSGNAAAALAICDLETGFLASLQPLIQAVGDAVSLYLEPKSTPPAYLIQPLIQTLRLLAVITASKTLRPALLVPVTRTDSTRKGHTRHATMLLTAQAAQKTELAPGSTSTHFIPVRALAHLWLNSLNRAAALAAAPAAPALTTGILGTTEWLSASEYLGAVAVNVATHAGARAEFHAATLTATAGAYVLVALTSNHDPAHLVSSAVAFLSNMALLNASADEMSRIWKFLGRCVDDGASTSFIELIVRAALQSGQLSNEITRIATLVIHNSIRARTQSLITNYFTLAFNALSDAIIEGDLVSVDDLARCIESSIAPLQGDQNQPQTPPATVEAVLSSVLCARAPSSLPPHISEPTPGPACPARAAAAAAAAAAAGVVNALVIACTGALEGASVSLTSSDAGAVTSRYGSVTLLLSRLAPFVPSVAVSVATKLVNVLSTAVAAVHSKIADGREITRVSAPFSVFAHSLIIIYYALTLAPAAWPVFPLEALSRTLHALARATIEGESITASSSSSSSRASRAPGVCAGRALCTLVSASLSVLSSADVNTDRRAEFGIHATLTALAVKDYGVQAAAAAALVGLTHRGWFRGQDGVLAAEEVAAAVRATVGCGRGVSQENRGVLTQLLEVVSVLMASEPQRGCLIVASANEAFKLISQSSDSLLAKKALNLARMAKSMKVD